MHARQADFSEHDAAAFSPVHPRVIWYCVPRCDTQMLCGYRESPAGGGGIGVAGASVGNSGSCRSCSCSGSSVSAAAAAELAALVGLAVRFAAALAVRQQRMAQQQPAKKPKRKINTMTMIVNFTVL